MENEYNIRLQKETEKIENKYEEQIFYLENENNFLKKVIYTLQKKFINLLSGYVLNFL